MEKNENNQTIQSTLNSDNSTNSNVDTQNLSKKELKKLKKKQKKEAKKTKRASMSTLAKVIQPFFIITIVALAILMFLSTAYFGFYLVGFFLGLLWFCIVFIVTVITLGMVWLNDGWKAFNSGYLDFLGKMFSKNPQTLIAIQKALPYIMGIAGALVAATLTMTIIDFVKTKAKTAMIKMIFSGVFVILYILFLVEGIGVLKMSVN